MTKGTSAQGEKNKTVHVKCRRCGEKSYHVSKERCSSCGFGTSSKRRGYEWQSKAGE